MNNDEKVSIRESDEYGVILVCSDQDHAEKFEDFLSEKRFALFKVRFDGGVTTFFFGQASCMSNVRSLYDSFVMECD